MATAKNKMMTEYETDPYDEVIFGRRRPDSVAIEWTSKTVYVLEFKRSSDQDIITVSKESEGHGLSMMS